MTLDVIFDGANVFVLPFWLLMIVLPKWGITQRIINSTVPFAILAVVYIYLFITGLSPETAESFANPTLTDLARLFSDPQITATGWVHFLVMDLFVGRWIYQEGLRTGVWTIHSLLLCLFAGPMGLLSHLATRFVVQAVAGRGADAPAESVPESP
ncbi:ABA4-like family protein [Leptolyngbya sp. CCY15150]|uniref:ABA4-like family protein n=1 Tax=Leptolyngbya sp. CCY15150 TaxID=2767772 RepID=UPI001950FE0E|nr:ABA4-like family protein [Leptolyngbya sp. CCY15150]